MPTPAIALPAAGLCALLATVLVLGAVAGPLVLTGGLLLAQGMLLAGWHRACGVGGAAGGVAVAGLAAVLADVLLALDVPGALDPAHPPAAVAAWVLGPAVLAAFLSQLARRDGRPDVVASMSATLAACVVVVLGALALPAADLRHGLDVLVVALVGAVLALAVQALPSAGGGGAGHRGAGVLVAAVTGAGLALLLEHAGAPLAGAAAAGVGALLALAGLALAGGEARSTRGARVGIAAATPVLLVAPLALALGRTLG